MVGRVERKAAGLRTERVRRPGRGSKLAQDSKAHTRRALAERLAAYHAGHISFAVLDSSIRCRINHVRYADSWGPRESVLIDLVIVPARHVSNQDTEKSRGRQ